MSLVEQLTGSPALNHFLDDRGDGRDGQESLASFRPGAGHAARIADSIGAVRSPVRPPLAAKSAKESPAEG
jgi:hypothetical protein